MDVRAAQEQEIDQLARLWHDGWHEAHAPIVPEELTRLRTLASFGDRLGAALPNVRVVGPPGAPVGFCIVQGDELYQLFVSSDSRGSGVAAALVADAEARLSAAGVETAWLACAIGNQRAARFYEKCGWHRAGNMINPAETSDGPFPLEVWRYEKTMDPNADGSGAPYGSTLDFMRAIVRRGLLILAAGFLAWELFAVVHWYRQTGGLGPGFTHLWQTLRSDWMALIVVSDHLVIASAVLVGLWLDATHLEWPTSRRVLLALAFVALGSPTLLTYLAWRVGRHNRVSATA
jgi:GNAT superfamily N-acetyltransferase